ncbi:MAG: phosphodiester glycosidase family protein, partial [Lentisphaeria bacterium]|nr:phosphodiester glycosidase family protein [Lentisphaeria bacterium]
LSFSLTAQEDLYDWSKTPDLFPGIKHVFIDTDQPRPLKINVIRIDLTRNDLRFMTVKRDPDWGKPMPDYPSLPIRVRRLSTWKFMRNALDCGIDMLLAVNATPWSPWKIPYTHSYGAKMGLVISDGDKIEEANGRPVFLITKDGNFQTRKVAKGEDVSNIRLALAGFSMILENGQVKDGKKNLGPRTAYGLSENRHYMIIMTVDGRMPGYSEGVNIRELGEWIRKYGASVALNMDGGGSTTLVVSDGKGGIRKLNKSLFYRTVATSLGICRIKKQMPRSGSKPANPRH